MGRWANSAKGKLDAERACAGKPPKKEGSRVRDLGATGSLDSTLAFDGLAPRRIGLSLALHRR